MTFPSELAVNIRILKALGDVRPFGPCKHFYILLVLKKLKKPNIITPEMLWRFLSLYFDLEEKNKEFLRSLALNTEPFSLSELGIDPLPSGPSPQ